jgi:ubiquinone/menaquinone biosynthesis C-methylase UbiE
VTAAVALSPALDLALDLFEPGRRPKKPDVRNGYLDLLAGGEDPTGAHPGQRLMASSVLPLVYERVWRPVGGRLLMGAMVPRMADEHRMALEMLDLGPGDRVLDMACGPGNFTRRFAREAEQGLVVGIDASATMLARAVDEGVPDEVAYIRGDASDLPFAGATFDAVCCFAALYLIEDPMAAIDEIVRVLAPGGRVALLSSVNRGLLPASATNAVVRRMTGVRIFDREELTRALHERGLKRVKRRVAGFAQFVSGTAANSGTVP